MSQIAHKKRCSEMSIQYFVRTHPGFFLVVQTYLLMAVIYDNALLEPLIQGVASWALIVPKKAYTCSLQLPVWEASTGRFMSHKRGFTHTHKMSGELKDIKILPHRD